MFYDVILITLVTVSWLGLHAKSTDLDSKTKLNAANPCSMYRYYAVLRLRVVLVICMVW